MMVVKVVISLGGMIIAESPLMDCLGFVVNAIKALGWLYKQGKGVRLKLRRRFRLGLYYVTDPGRTRSYR
jgi:hypothetical protein